jgi:hypothetical protein
MQVNVEVTRKNHLWGNLKVQKQLNNHRDCLVIAWDLLLTYGTYLTATIARKLIDTFCPHCHNFRNADTYPADMYYPDRFNLRDYSGIFSTEADQTKRDRYIRSL